MVGCGAARPGKTGWGTARQGKDTASMVSNPCLLIDKVRSWYGRAGLCGARPGVARSGEARESQNSSHRAWCDEARPGMAWRGKARHGGARLGKDWQGQAGRGWV